MPLLPGPTSRLAFRQMEVTDLDAVATLIGDPEVMKFYPRPRTRAEASDWIAWNQHTYTRDGFGLWLLHDAAGDFVGQCGLTWQMVDAEEQLEVAFHLMPEHHGKGLATEAATACLELARSRGIGRVISISNRENRPSQRVAEKLGLRHERDTVSALGEPITIFALDL